MINLNSYQDDAFDFYKSVVSSKQNSPQDPHYLDRIDSLESVVKDQYNAHTIHFQGDTLELLSNHAMSVASMNDLRKLYAYQNSVLQDLRVKLTTTNTGRMVICQSCTLNNANSFDHYISKGEFPEFAVNPINLIPCCSECNSLKSSQWRGIHGRNILNHYLDILPQVQYLYVDLGIGNKAIEVKFYLDNSNGVNNLLFERINNHYTRLELFRRFQENSESVISSLKDDIENGLVDSNFDLVRTQVLRRIDREKATKGVNYWQSVLKHTLINDEDFIIDYI